MCSAIPTDSTGRRCWADVVQKGFSSKSGVLSIVFGLALFISPVKLPSVVSEAMASIGQANTPVAMGLLGMFMAQADLKHLFGSKRAYVVSLVKLLVLPLFIVVVLAFCPFLAIKEVLTVVTAAPVGMRRANSR